MTVNDVVVGLVLVHELHESGFYARALFVYGVVKWVCQPIYGLFYLAVVYTVGNAVVDSLQFIAVIYEIFELDAFGMIEEQYVDGFVYGCHHHFAVAVVGEKEAVVGGDDKPTESGSCRFDAQLFHHRHADSFQQEVDSPIFKQLGGEQSNHGCLFFACHIHYALFHIIMQKYENKTEWWRCMLSNLLSARLAEKFFSVCPHIYNIFAFRNKMQVK